MTSPQFSIITPSYNYGHYIGECLQGVADQTGITAEHLVIDGGSNDETAAVVRGFPHATFLCEPDKGMTDAINKGFRIAAGEWVMWLNADDRLKPGALAEVFHFSELHREVDVIYGAWDYVDGAGTFLRTMSLFPFHRRMLVHYGCYIGSTACFYRRSTVIGEGHLLNDDFNYCMDGEYYTRLARLGKCFAYLPVRLADFRLHSQSISRRHLDSEGIEGLLKQQRQFAEPRAIRRARGTTLFKNDHLNGTVDCLLYFYYRAWKGVLRTQHSGRTRLPRIANW